ncbi:MAG TPA: flagellar hook protein FlgE [Rhizomicrobium sp.]|jgi:flagellar hook protein FlgE|nr:flagellar hook protein FlgE [Rhizomicrobium sp.]
MSIYGAMMIGVSGLDANSRALSVASSNIANVNTIGYKASGNAFSTLLASAAGSGDVSDAGVVANQAQQVTIQGGITSTQSPTDLALSGNGFFVVSTQPGTGGQQLYTRAGDFTPDSSGNLQNASGFYLQGWPLSADGSVPTDRNDLTDINVNDLAGKAEATTTMSIQANLQSSTAITTPYNAGDMASGAVTPDFQRTVNIYDSQGGAQALQVSYVKTGANTWNYEVTYQGAGSNLGSPPPTNNMVAAGTMTFNSDGTLKTADSSAASPTGSISVNIPWDTTASGLQPQTISINMGTPGSSDGVTQFDNPSALVSSKVDGALFGSLSGVSIDSDGFVTAQFSNGLSQKVFKIPVATFANPDGLSAVSGNAYAASNDSGSPTIGEANLGGAGTIQSKALEGSTVDLANEFTNLITTQRAYSASARIVTTADQMLQTLEQIQ